MSNTGIRAQCVKYHFLFLFKLGINVFDTCLKHVDKYLGNVIVFFFFCDYYRLFGINIVIKTFKCNNKSLMVYAFDMVQCNFHEDRADMSFVWVL